MDAADALNEIIDWTIFRKNEPNWEKGSLDPPQQRVYGGGGVSDENGIIKSEVGFSFVTKRFYFHLFIYLSKIGPIFPKRDEKLHLHVPIAALVNLWPCFFFIICAHEIH